MVGCAIAARQFTAIRVGPGTKKQSSMTLISASGRGWMMNLCEGEAEEQNPSGSIMLRIGLAMLQGARYEHVEALRGAAKELGVSLEIVDLRRSDQVSCLDGVILPGGESTAMKLASRSEMLYRALWSEMEQTDLPVLATCAGAILLCENNLLSASIERNSYGRQLDSFQAPLQVDMEISELDSLEATEHSRDEYGHKPLMVWHEAEPESEDFPGVFIRAPRFSSFECKAVVFLKEEVVGVLEQNRLALTFHPELTRDHRFHRWLLQRAGERR
jgi:5'-phosphate synthase pdxT subunit